MAKKSKTNTATANNAADARLKKTTTTQKLANTRSGIAEASLSTPSTSHNAIIEPQIKAESLNYKRLKRDCIQKKQLFVDLSFPPTNASLFLDVNRSADIVWKRPGNIVHNPKLFVEGASPNDVTQGILGNCWFVSACSALTHNEELLLKVDLFFNLDKMSEPISDYVSFTKKVIPNAAEQEWGAETVTGQKEHAYAGIFLFQFWRFGKWIKILIDDLLPTKDGKLLFARSKTPNEFWSALLEKAFAKLYGCYENLVGGQLADALQDVSGGVAETIHVQKVLNAAPHVNEFAFGTLGGGVNAIATDAPGAVNGVAPAALCDGNATPAPTDAIGRLFQMLRFAFNQQALIVAAIAAKNKEDVEKSLSCGLVKGHAYAVTAVRYIKLDAVKEHHRHSAKKFFTTIERKMMIRLQNPWGEKEWNGPWSDGSAEWEQVTATQKTELGITVDEDGEFWMPFDQFVKYFTDISVCQLFNTVAASAPNRFTTLVGAPRRSAIKRHRSKMRAIIASPKSFAYTPQASQIRAQAPHYYEYIFYDSWTTNGVKSGAPRDRSGGCQNFPATFCFNPQCFDVRDADSAAEVMIALTQKDVIPEHFRQREPFATIGIHVMRVECNRKFRIHQAINATATSDYASSRSIYLHLKELRTGRYVLMPTTYAPREQADFMLRLYSRAEIRPCPLIDDAPQLCSWNCSNVCCVTRMRLCEAIFISINELNVFCRVISGNKHVNSPTVRVSAGKARFNEMFLFHRTSLRQSYRFEVWETTVSSVRDAEPRGARRIAACSLNILTDNDCVSCTLDMSDGGGGAAGSREAGVVGKLNLEVCSYDDPMYL